MTGVAIAWINFAVLLISIALFTTFYIRSAGPAALARVVGNSAYVRCTQYRMLAGFFEFVTFANYVVHFYYPLPIGLPRYLPWPWWVSAIVAVAIALPSGCLMWRGLRDAGEETFVTKKQHTLYGGIYEKIRHPQAVGEMPFWWVFAFALHSPFLVLISFVWVPIFVAICWAEERDLVIRYGKAYEEYRERTGAVWLKRR